jgi:lysophospholipase L1-like esterase
MDGCQPGGSGGTPGSGGSGAGTGGVSGSGGKGGVIGMGGGGSTDTGGNAGSPGAGIPAGYPTPTADKAAKCSTVPMSGSYCPGGGAGPTCIQCLFGGSTYNTSESPPPPADALAAAGDYLVTVQLGAQGPVYVSAESSRGLLAQGAASTTYGFVVDVRGMEGQPNHSGGAVGYPGLDIFFSGPSGLKINGIGYALAAAATKPVMVYVAGDSTVCDQTGNDYAGWGQMLPQYFAPPVGIANYANSGASSSSFYSAFWGQIKAKWKAGDWVLIQFGHNDKNVSDAVVQANLEKYVSDAQAANVTPIVISPPARVQFSGSTVSDQSSLHAAAAKAAAAAKGCAYIDLTALSVAWYNSLGSSSASLKFHALGSDATHTNLAGADKLAGLIAGAIKTQNIGLAKYLR